MPPATVQRVLGGRAGRQVAGRARGIDPCPVAPRALPASASVSRSFPRHTLDGAAVRAALLDLVVTLTRSAFGRPIQPASSSPAIRSAAKARRHLPTVLA
ncbi:hypothetical protein [Streptomyces olivochromogenes]